jgi:Protein of unknown function (DUF2807).
MKKVGLIIFAVALLIGVIFANFISFGKADGGLMDFSFKRGVKGSGNIVTETRDISGFKGIDVSGVFNVEIVAQKEFGVQIEADDNLIPLILTEVNDGVLEISTNKRIRSSSRLTIRISAPDIDKIQSSGVAKVSLIDLKNSALKIDLSGASKVTVAGETSELNVEVSGASKVDAENLKTVNADVEASGASKVSVNVTGDLKADCSGASKVTYSGTPANIEKHSTGASKIEQR